MIEFSPYDTGIKSSNLNNFYTENLSSSHIAEADTLSFVLLSDSHFYYDKLSKAINSINTKKNIAFVAVVGDLTDSGLTREYEFYWKRMKKSRFPVISIIGNHDYLSNGYTTYSRMFGAPNFSFLCGGYKFIAFNSVVWENGNKTPDFKWLKNEIEVSDQKCIILTHIPPWGDQFTDEIRTKYYEISELPEVILNAHGHEHKYQDTLINGRRYIVNEALFENEYYIIHLAGDNARVEIVHF
jgi:predicted phosphodiesterase